MQLDDHVRRACCLYACCLQYEICAAYLSFCRSANEQNEDVNHHHQSLGHVIQSHRRGRHGQNLKSQEVFLPNLNKAKILFGLLTSVSCVFFGRRLIHVAAIDADSFVKSLFTYFRTVSHGNLTIKVQISIKKSCDQSRLKPLAPARCKLFRL